MNRLKQLLCIMLSFIMIISTSITTFASTGYDSSYNLTILEDSNSQKIVQTSDDDYTYIVTQDKINNTIQFTSIKKDTNTSIIGKKISTNNLSKSSIYENTFTNYEYTKTFGNPNTWELRRPDGSLTGTYYFKTYEVTKNKSYISTFKSAVDNINTLEGSMVAKGGISFLTSMAAGAISAGAIVTGGTLSAAAWTALVASAGASASFVSVCMDWDRACKTAYDAYFDTYTKSPSIFY